MMGTGEIHAQSQQAKVQYYKEIMSSQEGSGVKQTR